MIRVDTPSVDVRPAPVRFVDAIGGRPDMYLIARAAAAGTSERWRLYETRRESAVGEWVGSADYFRHMVNRLTRAGYSIAPDHTLEPCMCGEPGLTGYPCMEPDCPRNS